MYKTIGIRLMIGTVEDQMLPEQASRELATHIERIERAIRTADLQTRCLEWRCRREGHRTAEGTVAIGRCTHTTLNLHGAEQ